MGRVREPELWQHKEVVFGLLKTEVEKDRARPPSLDRFKQAEVRTGRLSPLYRTPPKVGRAPPRESRSVRVMPLIPAQT
jgi:hypothetical protein